jgi:hypothetical protein
MRVLPEWKGAVPGGRPESTLSRKKSPAQNRAGPAIDVEPRTLQSPVVVGKIVRSKGNALRGRNRRGPGAVAGLEPLRGLSRERFGVSCRKFRKRERESLHHKCESLRVPLAASPGCLGSLWLSAQPITHIAVQRRIENASQSLPAPLEWAGFCAPRIRH